MWFDVIKHGIESHVIQKFNKYEMRIATIESKMLKLC